MVKDIIAVGSRARLGVTPVVKHAALMLGDIVEMPSMLGLPNDTVCFLYVGNHQVYVCKFFALGIVFVLSEDSTIEVALKMGDNMFSVCVVMFDCVCLEGIWVIVRKFLGILRLCTKLTDLFSHIVAI